MFSRLILELSLTAARRRAAVLAFAAVAASVVALPAPSALAGACGDDVDGRRVACACGDVVVSDTALSAGDPVVSEACSGDGLFVSTPSGQAGITLDLSGLSIVGNGRGAGIRVVRGGTDGVAILGGEGVRAQIAGFATGIAAAGSSAVREIRNVDLVANAKDGMKVRSTGMKASDVSANRNGRSGLHLSGHGATLDGVEAKENAGTGIRLKGSGATVEGVSEGNAGAGARLSGRGHDLSSTELVGNGGAGVDAGGHGHSVSGAMLEDNAGGRVRGRAGAVK
ncbi:MAG TPA: hypothetical protein VEL28_07465 [Candidatus Binatia bacterium]|nr:hypothetical protein [Candidatus Binatia bacterium]